MSPRPRIIGLSFLTLLLTALPAVPARAQDSVESSCLPHVYDRIAHEERFFRSVLYGQKKSEDLPEGSVQFDSEFDTWIKVEENEWRSLDNEGLTWSDTLMDNEADAPPRRGLFETRKTPTSDLIPPILQSMRALQCRMLAVCAAAKASGSAEEGDEIKVKPDGCIEFTFTAFPGCIGDKNITTTRLNVCDSAVKSVMEREARLIQLVISYDAAYRTILQFAGTFEGFLDDFRFPLLQPLWQSVRALGQLDGLPCFLSQCDE